MTDLYFHKPQKKATLEKADAPLVRYDFSALSADRESFDFTLWRRYLKSALRQDERLLSYGAVQGEPDLREAVSQYISQKRNVVCTAENIVIGAGVQSLLHILCAMLTPGTICFQDKSFAEGQAIFRDHGFQIVENETDAQLLYTSPSHMNRWGDVMPAKARIALLKQAAAHGTLLIEDDYDNEFGYFDKPTPALQGLDGGHNVVYLGTFSKLLLPSIRLSFMVLSDRLLPRYLEIAPLYSQTASKAEQIALCQFIRDGHLASQIRKVRKLYAQKAFLLEQAVKTVFGDAVETHIGDTGFVVKADLRTDLSPTEVRTRALRAGILLRTDRGQSGTVSLLLSCSGLHSDAFLTALTALRAACPPKSVQ
ncbi:MAG: PLP-dependent aminotransferase family protein [Candidatus Fimenecus sp.]